MSLVLITFIEFSKTSPGLADSSKSVGDIDTFACSTLASWAWLTAGGTEKTKANIANSKTTLKNKQLSFLCHILILASHTTHYLQEVKLRSVLD